ncbi:helix-turn-helix domain-containing protein [Paenibacillus profundus]|uniref:Helix-turn-helix domain-containing protein n=1 Tax=Paenibacillus profundus TaxID=1173085 RepID=A0ABS8YMS2_9BACL|nr:helix-turn-helix domain-containing protein [Paenibacillus profundus]MCE5171607.1 helix-turn-helix domain-containing protein [Paenibacillus profundus]
MYEQDIKPITRRSLFYALTDIRYYVQLLNYEPGTLVAAQYSILAIAAGEGRLNINGTWCRLERGKGFILTPDMKVSIEQDSEAALEYYCVAFEILRTLGSGGELNSASNDEAPTFPCEGEVELHPFSWYIELIESIYRFRYESDEIGSFQNYVRFQELIAHILENNVAGADQTDTRAAVALSIERLRHRFCEQMTVDQMATEAKVGRWQYTRLFKQLTGTIPLDYLNELRMSRAKELLLCTEDRLHDIALKVGFSNEYYFNRRFTQTVGITPTRYRLMHRDDIRVISPYLEDFLIALGITPVVQCSHSLWGKQDYLGLDETPVFDVSSGRYEVLSQYEPDIIMIDGGMNRTNFEPYAPTYQLARISEDWRSSLRTMADWFGKADRAEEVIAQYESEAAAAKSILSRTAKGQSIAVLRITSNGIALYGGADMGYTGPVLYGSLGLTPHPLVKQLTHGTRRADLPLEWLHQLDADHLFITFEKQESSIDGEERKLLDHPLWRMLPAVRNQCVYEVDFLTWMNYGVISHRKKMDDVLQALA